MVARLWIVSSVRLVYWNQSLAWIKRAHPMFWSRLDSKSESESIAFQWWCVFFLESNWFLHDGLHTWKTFLLDPETDDGIRHLCCGDFSSAWFTSSLSAKKLKKSRVIHNILQCLIRKNTVQTVRSTLPVVVQIIDAMTTTAKLLTRILCVSMFTAFDVFIWENILKVLVSSP